MTTTSPGRRVIIVGCSARKLRTTTAVAALDLYQGWCVPRLRAHVDGHPSRREHVLVLSARYGLVLAETPLLPYDQPLAPPRAAHLRPQIHRAWVQQTQHTVVGELLLLLAPAYLELIAPSLLRRPPVVVHWIPDPTQAWEHAITVLNRWGWCPAPGVEAADRSPR